MQFTASIGHNSPVGVLAHVAVSPASVNIPLPFKSIAHEKFTANAGVVTIRPMAIIRAAV